jgi:uncharacterized protein (TIGR03067 family)
MKWRRILVLSHIFLLALLGSTSRADDRVKEGESDLAQIQGTWQLVYAETDGKTVPAERVRSTRVVIKDKSHSVFFGDQQIAHDVTFVLDSTATPKTTDDTLNEGPEKGKKIHGIYQLDGDTLISCVAKVDQKRPTEFATRPASGHTLRVFKRVRVDEDPKDKAIRDELIRFGGTWRFAEVEVEGEKMADEMLAENRLILQGDHFITRQGNQTQRGRYRIDPSLTPKTIDVVFSEGPDQGKTLRGIYELSADVYRVCLNLADQARPKEFASTPGSKRVLELLKRDKP